MKPDPELQGMVPASNGGLRCEIEKCKAACCRAFHFRPGLPGPCEHLRDDYRCQLHVDGGLECKPHGCVLYPRGQAEIDHMNSRLAEAGIAERCHLRFD